MIVVSWNMEIRNMVTRVYEILRHSSLDKLGLDFTNDRENKKNVTT